MTFKLTPWQTCLRNRQDGFTLVELLAVTVLGSVIALVGVASLRTLSDGRSRLDSYNQALEELRYVARIMRQDLNNLYRSGDEQGLLVAGQVLESGDGLGSVLKFRTISHRKARLNGSEGDIYEVEYALVEQDDQQRLVRRVWPHAHPLVETGGIRYAIAEHIVSFVVRYYDGQEWVEGWMPQRGSVPQLIEVALVARWPDAERLISRTMTVSFPRFPQGARPGGRGQEGPSGEGGQNR